MGWCAISVVVSANALIGIAEKLCPQTILTAVLALMCRKRGLLTRNIFFALFIGVFMGGTSNLIHATTGQQPFAIFAPLTFFEPSRRTHAGNFLSRSKISNYYARESYISTGI
jgi:hypothetical protein